MKNYQTFKILISSALLFVTSCGIVEQTPTMSDPLDSVRTAAAKTIEAMTTQIVATDQAAKTQFPNGTPFYPTSTPTADASSFLSTPALLQPTATPTLEVSTPSPTSCDLTAFVTETIPDGSQLYPGSTFTKTWTLKNAGTCTWTPDYDVVFIKGESMGAPASQQLTQTKVLPGETTTITMKLNAPTQAGNYRADFKLRNSAGVIFSFNDPDKTFWVDINVVEGKINLYDSYCIAVWNSAGGTLPCPGQPGDEDGYVYSDPSPILETGNKDDEGALWLGVQDVQDGTLRGTYPAMVIPEGARFRAILGCAEDQEKCNVNFSLNIREASGTVKTLASWDEVHDGSFQNIEYDLSAYGNKSLQIILILKANGSPEGDRVHLLAPIIEP